MRQIFTIGFLMIIIVSGCNDDASDKLSPVIVWGNPEDIKSGTPLSEIQLNATASVPGTFVYTPSLGAILEVGTNQPLNVEFQPSQIDLYNNASNSVSINVLPNGTSNALFNFKLTYGSVTDADGNSYKTITIGTQTWMAENLRTTKYQNGDAITQVSNNTEWKNLTTAAYSTYNNETDLDFQATNGHLYNWFAVSDSRDIAPKGWHVATEGEWQALADFLGGLDVAGGKLKETGSGHWNNPNTSANNSNGFTALPSGRREYTDGSFINEGFNGFWWTSSPYNPDYSWYFQVNYDFASLVPANFHKQYGFSVRCVKD